MPSPAYQAALAAQRKAWRAYDRAYRECRAGLITATERDTAAMVYYKADELLADAENEEMAL